LRLRAANNLLAHQGKAHKIELLRAANERAGKSTLLFPSPVDSKPIRRRSATRAGLASDNGVLDIGTHDLRRTFATGLGEMGVADQVIERVLNHAPRTVAGKHYNHAKLFEGMRTALEAWSERVRGIVGARRTGFQCMAIADRWEPSINRSIAKLSIGQLVSAKRLIISVFS